MICTDETEAPGIEVVPALCGIEVGRIAVHPAPGVLSETAVALRSWMPRRGLGISRSYPRPNAMVEVLTVLSKSSGYLSRLVCTYKITRRFKLL